MLHYIPLGAASILDVGCATGRFGELLRSTRDARLVGIDITPHPDGRPLPYDVRLVGSFPNDLPAERFDCIVFNDVLEHMVDPWAAVSVARELLTPTGTVVASIPNIRNVMYVLKPLLVNGRWSYGEQGILDRTHLRFFTRSSIVDLFEQAGFTIERLEPLLWESGRSGRWATLNRWLRGRLDDLVCEQFAVVARV